MFHVKPDVKLASNILIFIGLLFIINQVLRLMILQSSIYDRLALFWLWVLVNKLVVYSVVALYLACHLMGKDNHKYIDSFLLVVASAFMVGVGGCITRWLFPAYTLHDIPRAVLGQLYVGLFLLGVLGRLGYYEPGNKKTETDK